MYYTELKSYAYNNKPPKKISVDDFIKLLDAKPDTCLLEVLVCDTVKVFFDIDKLNSASEFEEILVKLRLAFEEKFNVSVNKIAITKNTKKFSYHVYFPEFRTTKEKLKNFIEPLRKTIPQLDRIYTKNRLFRCINQPKPMPNGIVDKSDKHFIMQGSIKDTIIQDKTNTILI